MWQGSLCALITLEAITVLEVRRAEVGHVGTRLMRQQNTFVTDLLRVNLASNCAMRELSIGNGGISGE